MSKLGVGIVGCGNISTIYMQNMPNFRDLNLVACADLRPEAAQAQAEKFGIEALSIDALMARSDIQIIINLTTPKSHFAISHAALTANKHVFGEKPITIEAERRRDPGCGGRASGPEDRLRAGHFPWRRRTDGARTRGCRPDRQSALRDLFSDVAWHGALAPRSNLLLQTGRWADP